MPNNQACVMMAAVYGDDGDDQPEVRSLICELVLNTATV
jgi:hypothetical protein